MATVVRMPVRETRGDAVELADDIQLVQAARNGSRKAFEQLVERYKKLVYSLAYTRTGSFALSEEIAQDIFVEAWRNLDRLRDPARFRSWICSIARFVTHSSEKDERRRMYARSDAYAVLAGETSAAAPSTLDQIIVREEEALLWRALRQVPERYRVPLVLYYMDGRSVESVAAALDLTHQNVQQRLSR